MTHARAFVALGSNDGGPPARLAAALDALDRDALKIAAAARLVWTPYEGGQAPDVLNTVVEVRTTLAPRALLERLRAIEAAEGRDRTRPLLRRLDLDLLAYDDVELREPGLELPHPRCAQRRFVLDPWQEIAPLYELPGTGRTVLAHARGLARTHGAQEAYDAPRLVAPLRDRATSCVVLEDRAALAGWRLAQPGTVGVVMTMGALHAGHASLVQRAAAECDAVVATIFVNPAQFAAGEDLARYPRTFEDDLALLRHHGADAVYAPTPEDVYPAGFATQVVPEGAAGGYEGASRPTHFAGVATVVTKLWQRTRAHRSYFGRKDAQQLAVLGQVRRDLDLAVEVVGCEIVRAPDELALSSRNRYLDDETRRAAPDLARALRAVGDAIEGGEEVEQVLARARDPSHAGGAACLAWDYLDVVDPDTMRPLRTVQAPALAIGAARLGAVRLIDNRWVAPPRSDA